MKTCSFEGCGRKHAAKGLCQSHYYQRYVAKTHLTPIGETWGTHSEEVSYLGAHKRAYRLFGKASDYLCHFCLDLGEMTQAQEFGYLGGGGANERTAMKLDTRRNKSREVAYSQNPLDYRPMCKGCHTRYDMLYAKIIAALKSA